VTYTELRTILRRDLLAEASSDYWTDDDLFAFLKRAAMEVAHEFGFPTNVSYNPVQAGATELTLPSGSTATVQVNEVTYGGMRLALAPMAVVIEYQNMSALRFPRYYNIDPKRVPWLLTFGPPAPTDSVMVVETITEYDSATETEGQEPWGGLFRRYHELVAYRAAVKAFESSMEEERAAYMQQRAQQLAQSFALFLGKSDVAQAIAGEGVAAS
jgi:hypothetical protein